MENPKHNLDTIPSPQIEGHSPDFTQGNDNRHNVTLSTDLATLEHAFASVSNEAFAFWLVRTLDDQKSRADMFGLGLSHHIREVVANLGNVLPTFILMREALRRQEQNYFEGVQTIVHAAQGTPTLDVVTALLAKSDPTGQAHLDYWTSTLHGAVPEALAMSAGMLAELASDWSGSAPDTAPDWDEQAQAARLTLDAIQTATQTLSVQLAQAEYRASQKAVTA